MKIQCDYCGNTYEDTQEKCPNCGAPNPSHQNTGKPKTIEELKDWYRKRNLPAPEVTRFFIGEDYKKPKAFGIFKDEATGDFIVYKNKADGSRAVRYQGKDEQYAVNELYQRLKDEIVHQKHLNEEKRSGGSGTRSAGSGSRKKSGLSYFLARFSFYFWIIAFVGALIFSIVIIPIKNRHNGYYQYGDTILYNCQDDWFYWDDNDWSRIGDYYGPKEIAAEIEQNYDEYYLSKDWNSSYYVGDWDDSSYYDQYHSSSDSDSDYDWSSDDSWDSGGTDWDSDW